MDASGSGRSVFFLVFLGMRLFILLESSYVPDIKRLFIVYYQFNNFHLEYCLVTRTM